MDGSPISPIKGLRRIERVWFTLPWIGLTMPVGTGSMIPVTTYGGRLTPEQTLTTVEGGGVCAAAGAATIVLVTRSAPAVECSARRRARWARLKEDWVKDGFPSHSSRSETRSYWRTRSF
ncbi:hypothetical protein GCM10022281_03700 [Sphingomonas rosea]|uniref:Uncharacterized protein n=1 Tax=Sphingomonas rosea TaxID=335605 RepID=A0ABP7TLP1_9SPHN